MQVGAHMTSLSALTYLVSIALPGVWWSAANFCQDAGVWWWCCMSMIEADDNFNKDHTAPLLLYTRYSGLYKKPEKIKQGQVVSKI
jgi:hypothetical protein